MNLFILFSSPSLTRRKSKRASGWGSGGQPRSAHHTITHRNPYSGECQMNLTPFDCTEDFHFSTGQASESHVIYLEGGQNNFPLLRNRIVFINFVEVSITNYSRLKHYGWKLLRSADRLESKQGTRAELSCTKTIQVMRKSRSYQKSIKMQEHKLATHCAFSLSFTFPEPSHAFTASTNFLLSMKIQIAQ